MATPYMAGPFTIVATGGESTCVELRVPHRGTIKAVKFNQLSGVEVACAFELFTLRAACPPGSDTGSSSSSASASLVNGRDMYSVCGQKSRLAATLFAEFETTYPYVNQDGTATVPHRRLFLEVIPEGTGVKEYEIALEIMSGVLG